MSTQKTKNKNYILKLFSIFFFVLKVTYACDYVDKFHWETMLSGGGKRIQDVTVFKEEKLCEPELSIWRERINHIHSNIEMRDKLIAKNNIQIYTSKYKTGAWGFRETPQNNFKASKHLILAGDSLVFGVGVNDEETIAQLVAKDNHEYRIFNLGFPDRASSSFLYMLENYNLKSILPSLAPQGRLIYVFTSSQFKILLGAKNLIEWGAQLPNYEINKNGEVYFAGHFDDLFLTKVYRALNFFSFLNSVIPNFPLIRDKHLIKISKIFLKIKQIYLSQTNEHNNFMVVLVGSNGDLKKQSILKKLEFTLRRQKIETLLLEDFQFQEGYIYPDQVKNLSKKINQIISKSK